jgi:hypothetical protein
MPDEKAQTMHDWSYASSKIEALEGDWATLIAEADRRRLVRHEECDILKLRAQKKIALDAVRTPRRIADKNIRRELAPDVAYITQSRDMAKFVPIGNLGIPVEPLEREFTKLCRYKRWQRSMFSTCDGTKTHGWDAIETLFDASKPGHFCWRHIGNQHLLFPLDTSDIQDAPYVIILYGTTLPELDAYTEEHGFNPEQVELVRKKLKEMEGKGESKITLKKLYFKDEGVVYIGWSCDDASDWLLAPSELYLGVEGEDGTQGEETEYPIDILEYSISENENIVDTRGRVFLDEPDQEACTHIQSSYVNRWIRSTYILSAPENPSDDNTSKQTEIRLKDGAHLPSPTRFFNIEPPDPSGLSAMQQIVSQNSDEAGQVNYAANNRKDSRKTAAEVQSSERKGSELSGVQVTLLSDFMASLCGRAWRIIQSQVNSGKIESAIPNWKDYYQYEPGYHLLAAGDIEVVKRQEIVMAMKQDWPVIQQTAAAQVFLEDLMRFGPYGENADKYINAISSGNRKDNLIMGMRKAIESLIVDPATGQPRPEVVAEKDKFMQLLAEYDAVMNPEAEPGKPPEAGSEPVAPTTPDTPANPPKAY